MRASKVSAILTPSRREIKRAGIAGNRAASNPSQGCLATRNRRFDPCGDDAGDFRKDHGVGAPATSRNMERMVGVLEKVKRRDGAQAFSQRLHECKIGKIIACAL